MSNSHSKTTYINVRRLIAFVFVLALLGVGLLHQRLSSAAPTPSEKRNVRARMSSAEEYAPSSTMVTPMFAAITVDRTDDIAGASACTAAANDCSLRGAVAFANLNPGTTINVPAPVAEFPEITQFVKVNELPIEPEIMPPPPMPVLSVPPEIVTSEILVMKFASKFGLTSTTRSPAVVW